MTATLGFLTAVGSTVSFGAAGGTTAAVIGGLTTAAAAAGAGLSTYEGISAYRQGRAQASQLRGAAAAAQAEADAAAAEQERQARIEAAKAGIAQIQGEQEAERRSRVLANDIGSMYANYAGNGLIVDGTAKDTIGAALRTQVGEAESDISAIRDNAAMDVWTHQANAASHRASAKNARIAGRNQAALYLSQAKDARRSGRNSMLASFGKAGLQIGGLALTAGAGGAFSGTGGGLAPFSPSSSPVPSATNSLHYMYF